MAERLTKLSCRMPVVVSTRRGGEANSTQHLWLRSVRIFYLSRRGLMLGGWLTTGKLHILLICLLADGQTSSELKRPLRVRRQLNVASNHLGALKAVIVEALHNRCAALLSPGWSRRSAAFNASTASCQLIA